METDKLLLELQSLGFSDLADWIHEEDIDLKKSLSHLEENKHMIDDEEDIKAFKRAEKIIYTIFSNSD